MEYAGWATSNWEEEVLQTLTKYSMTKSSLMLRLATSAAVMHKNTTLLP